MAVGAMGDILVCFSCCVTQQPPVSNSYSILHSVSINYFVLTIGIRKNGYFGGGHN